MKVKLFDRDLSWLSFNYRVLMEAMDNSVPLLERLKFLAIYSSNLDEFFRVRVADVINLAQIDKKKINKKANVNPDELLEQIHEEVGKQLDQYGATLREVIASLKERNIVICQGVEEIPKELLGDILHYFKTKVAAYLKPINLDKQSRLFLDNQALYLAISFQSGSQYCVKIPSDQLPRFFKGKVNDSSYFVFLDDVIRLHLDLLFPGEKVKDCSAIKLNKDADLQIEDEYHGDLIEKIEKQIKKRNLGVPSRFLFDGEISDKLMKTLMEKLELSENEVVTGGRYHNLNDFFQISASGNDLEYPKNFAIRNEEVDKARSIFKLLDKKDLLFHFPYQPYDYVLQFFNEAALDPEVTEINVTFYRMAKDSVIGEALISAAAVGKKVCVFMEVKARFDEQNNLDWARRMTDAGVKIIYSLPGLKVHAKVALVKKKNKMYGFFGTGNLNEKTSEIYCDHGLLSSHKEMTKELSNVFEFLIGRKEPTVFNHLIVSQFNAMDRFKELIDREISLVEEGKKGSITIKLNNLQEPQLIEKLYEAAEKGVDVRMIVRSICCLVPDHKGIKVKRIVDRYLEHARVFCFGNDGKPVMYLGSSDWMNRNLHRRIEVSFPLYGEEMVNQLKTILDLQWEDDVKGVWLSKKLANKRPEQVKGIQAQKDTFALLRQ